MGAVGPGVALKANLIVEYFFLALSASANKSSRVGSVSAKCSSVGEKLMFSKLTIVCVFLKPLGLLFVIVINKRAHGFRVVKKTSGFRVCT